MRDYIYPDTSTMYNFISTWIAVTANYADFAQATYDYELDQDYRMNFWETPHFGFSHIEWWSNMNFADYETYTSWFDNK